MRKALLLSMFFITLTFIVADDTIINQTYQIANLENRIDDLEVINGKLLSSVYWTIGSFSILVFAFMAVNIIAGIQIKKRELENISNDLEKKQNKVFSEKSEGIDRLLEEKSVEIKNEINSKIASNGSSQAGSIRRLQSDLLEFRKDYLEYYNKKEKDEWRILKNLLEIIEIDVKDGYPYRINESLDNLYDYIYEKEISFDDVNDIQETLSKLGDEFMVRKEKITENMKIKR